jgi:hypothetical protein
VPDFFLSDIALVFPDVSERAFLPDFFEEWYEYTFFWAMILQKRA